MSALPDEVVEAKTSVEEPLVAVYASCHCVGMPCLCCEPKVEIHQVRFTDRIVDLPVDGRGTYREMSSPIMEKISADVPISPHEHAQGRFVEQSEHVVVPPIMEGIPAIMQIHST